jgi:S-(hydroxymethyl)glutathione dehydrogenase/alcohol dehydrogenase
VKVKAAIVPELGAPFIVEEIEMDSPLEHEVRVEVRGSGLCHSDIGVATTPSPFAPPFLLGHEVAGVVAQVGSAVTEFAVGDEVVACSTAGCRQCAQCRAGRPIRCLQPWVTERGPDHAPRVSWQGKPLMQFMGIGGFAQQALVHENLLVKIDSAQVPFDRACLLGCAVVTGAGAALNTAAISVRDTVAVIGCGGVGLNVIQGAALAGATRIIAVDVQPSKLELARQFGATDVVDAAQTDAVAVVRELTGGGVSASFEVIGKAQTAKQALDMLGIGGTAYLIGVQDPKTQLQFDLFEELIFPQKSILGVSMGSTIPQIDIPRFAQLYDQGRFKLDELVSQRINLAGINDGYEQLAGGAVARSVITSF